VKIKKISTLITLVVLIGTFISVIPQQAFADTAVTVPTECDVVNNQINSLVTDHFMFPFRSSGQGSVDVTAVDSQLAPFSNDVVFVLNPGPGSTTVVVAGAPGPQTQFIAAGFAPVNTLVTVTACYGDTAPDPSGNLNMLLFHVETITFAVPGPFSGKVPSCPDGVIDVRETCDDNNSINGDGCDANCQVEFPPIPVCGNGATESGEECDDGNLLDGDGCSSICLAEGTAVDSAVITPQFCGLVYIDPVTGIVTFPDTVNFAVSDGRFVIIGNSGNGPGVVTIAGSGDPHRTTGELIGNWLDDNGDFLWEVFRARFASAVSPQDVVYGLMTPITFIPQTFIAVLDGQDQAERILKVRPFDQLGRDNVLGHSIYDLEIDCRETVSCPDGQLIFNGDCVNQCPDGSIPDAENRKCVLDLCGDGFANNPGIEECDGFDLGGMSCLDLGFDFGVLGCFPSCEFDTSGCILE